MKNKLIGLMAIIIVSVVTVSVSGFINTASADYTFYSSNDIFFYDKSAVMNTCTASPLVNNGKDYAGREILNSTQIAKIEENRPVYEEAAQSAGIPWGVLAVLHYRETGLKVENPSNKQGIYQEYAARDTDKYPPGAVDREGFLEQSIWAAEFFKGKTSKSGLDSGDPGAIKDAFFGYNGRAKAYIEQAKALGFDEDYEGSPYVMNMADARRDPSVLPPNDTTWGQIVTDGGSIEYNTGNTTYGAFVLYSAVSNISSGACDTMSGPTVTKVVAIAEKELSLWESGSMSGNGTDYLKYTNQQQGNWCAWFASWVYNEAGYPISTTSKNGEVPAVDGIRSIGQDDKRFSYSTKDGYTPKIGDLVIQKNDASHVHIVTEVKGNNITTIGGNQGYGGNQGATGFANSKVTKYTYDFTSNSKTTGYVSPRG